MVDKSEINKFDIISATYEAPAPFGSPPTNPKEVKIVGIVFTLSKKDDTVRVRSLDSNDGYYHDSCELQVDAYHARGLDQALEFVEKKLALLSKQERYSTQTFWARTYERWLKGHKLKRLIAENKKQNKLLVAKHSEAEYILDRVLLSDQKNNVGDIRVRVSPLVTTSRDFPFLSIDWIDLKALRVADVHELLTCDSTLGRAFALDPLLEWIPKVSEKIKENIDLLHSDARSTYINLRWLEDQERFYPSGLPKKARELLRKIAEEKIAGHNLREKLRAVLDEAQEVYKEIDKAFAEELKRSTLEKK